MNTIITTIKRLLSNRRRFAFVVIVVVAISLLALGQNKKSDSNSVFQTATVEKGNIVSSVSASGTVVSANTYKALTNATGVVDRVYVNDGDTVVKGQKLAVINLDSTGQSNYASAYTSYVSATNSVRSAESSYRSSQASLAVVYDQIKGHDNDETLEMKETRTKAEVANDNAYNATNAAKAQLTNASLSLRLASATITAPESGIISNLSITPGLNVSNTSTQIATIGIDGAPLVEVNISEIDVPSVQIGQKATLTFDSIQDKTFTGEVMTVDRVGVSTSGVTTYPSIIRLDTNATSILPNMSVSANIVIDTKTDVLIVPSAAITSLNDQSIVTVQQEGKQQSVSIETGISSDTYTEIVSGLSEGDVVVTGTTSTSESSSTGSSPFGSFGGGTRFIQR